MPAPALIAIVGATATGKSAAAIALASHLERYGSGAEIINADAMQLYRGMDIGTAKVPPSERADIPHHLLDVLEVTAEASVSDYQRDARELIDRIQGHGKTPILVGGSGLYVRAAIDQIDFPPTDPIVRSRLEAEAASDGTTALFDRLMRTDPQAAGIIKPGDQRRIIRAMEVHELTGRPFTAFMPRRLYHYEPTVQIGIRLDRSTLHDRIATRVQAMVSAGLLNEVAGLRTHGLEQGLTAKRAIGYEQALAVLDGDMACADAIESTIVGTRRLVRKQDTWFHRDPRISWLDAVQPEDPSDEQRLLAQMLDVIDGAHP